MSRRPAASRGGPSLFLVWRSSSPSITHPGGKYLTRKLRIFTLLEVALASSVCTLSAVKGHFAAIRQTPATIRARIAPAVILSAGRRGRFLSEGSDIPVAEFMASAE